MQDTPDEHMPETVALFKLLALLGRHVATGRVQPRSPVRTQLRHPPQLRCGSSWSRGPMSERSASKRSSAASIDFQAFWTSASSRSPSAPGAITPTHRRTTSRHRLEGWFSPGGDEREPAILQHSGDRDRPGIVASLAGLRVAAKEPRPAQRRPASAGPRAASHTKSRRYRVQARRRPTTPPAASPDAKRASLRSNHPPSGSQEGTRFRGIRLRGAAPPSGWRIETQSRNHSGRPTQSGRRIAGLWPATAGRPR